MIYTVNEDGEEVSRGRLSSRKDGREEGIGRLMCGFGLGLDATEYEGAVQGGCEDDVQGGGGGSRFVSVDSLFRNVYGLVDVLTTTLLDLSTFGSLRSNDSHDLRNEEPRSLQVQAQVFESGYSESLCKEAVCKFRFDLARPFLSLFGSHLHSSHLCYHFL